MPGPEVFISYRREDAGDAGRLSDWLMSHFGADGVFMDTTGIGGGRDFPTVIGEAIRNCKAVVAVVTPRWGVDLGDGEDWVRRELRDALAAERPIVPVLFHGTPPPQRSQLPAELAVLADKQAMVVSDLDYRDDVGRVIETLESFGAEAPTLEVFVDIPRSARAEARAGWNARISSDRGRKNLLAALATHGIRMSGEHGGDVLLQGGSKWKTRVFGGLQGPESRLPKSGRLRVRDRGAGVAIEVLLAEDWGAGVFTGLEGRYTGHFEKVIADLRRATES